MTNFGKLVLGGILIIIVIIIVLFVNKKEIVAPVVPDVVDKTMPPVDGKDLIQGNKDDLISFSISPNSIVYGIRSYRGVVQGGYFFEANIVINVLDANKNLLKASNAVATSEWMTAGPVDFEGNIDLSGLPKGPAFIEIHNDNPSGLPEHDKSILIPIIID